MGSSNSVDHQYCKHDTVVGTARKLVLSSTIWEDCLLFVHELDISCGDRCLPNSSPVAWLDWLVSLALHANPILEDASPPEGIVRTTVSSRLIMM